MILNILGISRKPKQTQYGEKISVGLKTKEYGEKWLNGWADEVNSNWQKGQAVEATVEQKGDWLNFKATKPSVSPQAVNTPAPSQNAYTSHLGATKGQPETNWDRISWGKCKTLFLVEAYKLGKLLTEAEPQAEAWADASMRKMGEPEFTDYSGDDDEIRVDNIPF